MGAQPARVRMATGRCLALTVAPCVSTFPAAHRFSLTRRGGWLATTAASSANYSLLCAWPRLSLWRLPIPQPAICARRSSTRAFEKLLLSADSFVTVHPHEDINKKNKKNKNKEN